MPVQAHIVDSHRIRDVFKLMLPHIAGMNREFTFDLLIGVFRKAERTRPSQRLHPSGNIDTIAINVVVIVDDDVANIDADAKFDSTIFGNYRVTLGHLLLYFDSALGCINGAREFNEHGVAWAI